MPVLKLLESRPGGPLLEAYWKGSSFIHPTCVSTQSQLGTAALWAVQFSVAPLSQAGCRQCS